MIGLRDTGYLMQRKDLAINQRRIKRWGDGFNYITRQEQVSDIYLTRIAPGYTGETQAKDSLVYRNDLH